MQFIVIFQRFLIAKIHILAINNIEFAFNTKSIVLTLENIVLPLETMFDINQGVHDLHLHGVM